MGDQATTLEFFGTTTFRLKANGLTILHDTWLEKPVSVKRHLELESVTECDYIVISHAHFDHLPGADRLALRTGATVIANSEAINCLRQAGVPDNQLISVAGGERLPLFSRDNLERAAAGTIELSPPISPLAPPTPHVKFAALAVHVWPSLHSLMPGTSPHDIPEIFDSGKVYATVDNGYACSHNITQLMKHGLFRLLEFVPEDKIDAGTRAFADYVQDRKRNVMSACDGGQMMYNFVIGDKSVLFNTHLGSYEGIMRYVEPKPDVAILGAGGVANLNGRPFDGTAAEFLTRQVRWLGEPSKVFFCLHDKDNIIKPYSMDTTAAQRSIEEGTSTRVVDTQPVTIYKMEEVQEDSVAYWLELAPVSRAMAPAP
ncbi:hypothetical protein VTL71DRAFT_12293 [Oculimacula yallundae]|uniref:Metallo-beta-lactamase domain-containing protein n=1 Tax=Oculimacula yallundae TaxID=86028 RepID=A0ABR4CM69_9HELO